MKDFFDCPFEGQIVEPTPIDKPQEFPLISGSVTSFVLRDRMTIKARMIAPLETDALRDTLAEAIEATLELGMLEFTIEDIVFFDDVDQKRREPSPYISTVFDILAKQVDGAAKSLGISASTRLCLRFGKQYDLRCIISANNDAPIKLEEPREALYLA